MALELTMMRVFTRRWPRVQAWAGEGLFSSGAKFIIAIQSYGEAALTVVRMPATARKTDDRRDAADRPKIAQPSGHDGGRNRAPHWIMQSRSEMAGLRDEVDRLREETRRLVQERRHIVATARLPLTHPARKQHLLDWVSVQRLRR